MRLRPGWRALLVALAGCRAGPSASETGSGEEGEPEDDYEIPAFVDPASGELSVEHDTLDTLLLRVTGAVPGRTQLQIDGTSVGTLVEPSPLGQLGAEALRLELAGAMVAGDHTLRLLTPGSTQQQLSSIVDVRIRPGQPPALGHELGATAVAPGAGLHAVGSGPRGLLLIVGGEDPADATVSVLRANGTAWDAADVRSVSIAGHVQGASDPVPAVTACVIAGAQRDRIRVAWRVGAPGRRIDALELEWGESENIVGQPLVVVDDAAVEAEWVEIRRPHFVGPNLLTEAWAPADTERVLPGDRTVLASAWATDAASPAPPARVGFGARVDLDLVSPVVDVARDDDAQLAVRFDRRRPAVLRWDAGSALPSLVGASTSAIPVITGDPLGMGTVLGAFGSRTILTASSEGALRVLLADTNLGRGAHADPAAGSVPDQAPTGAPAAGVVLGTAFFVVPYGDATEVRVVLADGEASVVVALDGLHCDAVAVPIGAEVNEGPSMAFACARDGEVRLGALFASGSD